jgi:Concanavalin A-like lectin/glucanases superfamily/Bacterial TSP3 repeat
VRTARAHFFLLVSYLWILASPSSQAIIDTNSNTLSDLWEKSFNSDQLFPATPNFLPLADPDKDSWTNAQEAEAGTNPFSSNPPLGFLRLQITTIPAVYYTSPETGLPALATPAAFLINWPTLVGKQYTLLVTPDLSPGSWLPVGPPIIGQGTTINFPLAPTYDDGSMPDKLFWRVAINDLDSDGDGLTDHEESKLGTDPNSIDTDLDGLLDGADPLPLTSATVADPDGSGLPTSLATQAKGLIGRWDLENQQTISPVPAGYTPNRYPDSSGNNFHATSFSVFPHPEGIISKATNHQGGFVSIPSTILNNRKIYTTAFWARLEPGCIANANGAAVGLFSHHQRVPVYASGVLKVGLYSEQLNGLWFEKSGNNELLRAGTYTFINYLNGVSAPPLTTNTGLSITRPAGTADDGQWHHYTLVRNDAVTILYIDGVLIGQATAAAASIPSNSNAAISLGRVNGPSPASTTPVIHGTSPTRGRFDRLRMWNRVLTPAEALDLYQEDADHDGLINVIENATRFWRDRNANRIIDPGEQSYTSSPFIWQSPSHDSDEDGLSDILETTLGTNPYNPDTDGDRMPDGWEYDNSQTTTSFSAATVIASTSATTNNSPDPRIPDATADPDNDGVSNLDEYRHNTKPRVANSDGDSKNDGQEIAQDSDPNDNSDQGQPPAPDQKLSILLGIGDQSGSHSEDYILNCYRLDPQSGQEIRVFTHVSGGFGQYQEVTKSLFKKGTSYTFQIDWQATNLTVKPATPGFPAEGPDFDYTFKVQPQGSLASALFIPSYDPKTRQASTTALLSDSANDVAQTSQEFKKNYESLRAASLQAYLRDIKDSTNTNDDVTITPWDTATQPNPTDANIAWIEAHKSATNAAPRMPQLELKISGLPATTTIQAKLEVKYTRGNGSRPTRHEPADSPPDNVNIPTDGSFQTITGDTWKIWETYASETFFGGEATLTYKLMTGTSETVAPQTIRFRVGGKNPDASRARTHIESLTDCGPTGSLWFAYAIARSESQDYNGSGTRYNQFLRLPQNPRDNGLPLFGDDDSGPGGYGMFQVTGNVQSSDTNIARDQIWNWQTNATAARVIIVDKRRASTNWMTKQTDASHANGAAIPPHTTGNVTFDGTTYTMTHACTIKAYNGASKPSSDTDGATIMGFVLDPSYPSIGHYGYWHSGQDKWGLCRFNNLGFNYVLRVCEEVQP